VLTGGGARAAYQVGVVKAVRDILGNPVKNPFPILCGTSAGAINAATLAVFADNFSRGVANLLEVWENMRCEHIYRTDAWNIMKSGARWFSAMMLISRHNPVSLLETSLCARCWKKILILEKFSKILMRATCTPRASRRRATPPGKASPSSRAAAASRAGSATSASAPLCR